MWKIYQNGHKGYRSRCNKFYTPKVADCACRWCSTRRKGWTTKQYCAKHLQIVLDQIYLHSRVGMTYQGKRLVLEHIGLILVHSQPWEKDWCVLREFFLARRLDSVLEYWAVGLHKVMCRVLMENLPRCLGPKLVNYGATLTWEWGRELLGILFSKCAADSD